jgi:Nucleotidyl transferase AbiEii toxin, Type IV TA system
MHKEILAPEQLKLLPMLRYARKRGFYLVGWTAIALYLGHRESIDFDLFRFEEFQPASIDNILRQAKLKWDVSYIKNTENCTGVISGVKCTFFAYPFQIEAKKDFSDVIRLPTLLDLAAMKAYALGRRSKWKDYVDLYFIIRNHFSIEAISSRAKEIFTGSFNTALFREQLHYFEWIDYSESVHYLISSPPPDGEVREFLRVASLQ